MLTPPPIIENQIVQYKLNYLVFLGIDICSRKNHFKNIHCKNPMTTNAGHYYLSKFCQQETASETKFIEFCGMYC